MSSFGWSLAIVNALPSIVQVLVRNALGQLPPPKEVLDKCTFFKGAWIRDMDDCAEKEQFVRDHKSELQRKYGITHAFYNYDACQEHVLHTCPKYIIRVYRNGLRQVIYLDKFDGVLRDGQSLRGIFYPDPGEPWKSFPIRVKIKSENDRLEIEEQAYNPLTLYYKAYATSPNQAL